MNVLPSILFPDAGDAAEVQRQAPSYFADLNLDQIVGALAVRRSFYDLAPYFHTVLHSAEATTYRHDVFRDPESPTLLSYVVAFGDRMRHMRERLAQAMPDP
ncbi:hypothetical protein ACFXPV_33845 [Streptomyces sp. NPDC059118]|uniref:hypothetical protein n=1 Tax=unclassified Streptomyces TaxID=2593676 RepID=UPI0036AA727D